MTARSTRSSTVGDEHRQNAARAAGPAARTEVDLDPDCPYSLWRYVRTDLTGSRLCIVGGGASAGLPWGMPARLTHALIFAADLERLATFYAGALGFQREATAHPSVVMLRAAGGAAIALHQAPPHAVEPLPPDGPRRREDTALKLCFEVDDLTASRQAVLDHGGLADPPWAWAGDTYCECADAEGNVVQLIGRGATPATA
ncbi:MAG: VOC family protein [Kofleriaceae bacterium]